MNYVSWSDSDGNVGVQHSDKIKGYTLEVQNILKKEGYAWNQQKQAFMKRIGKDLKALNAERTRIEGLINTPKVPQPEQKAK